MRMRVFVYQAVALLLVELAGGWARPVASTDLVGQSSPATASPNIVTVVASEYSFTMPSTIPEGLTAFRLLDQGREPHHLMLFRLDRGRSVRQAIDSLTMDRSLPLWMHAVGGPNTPAPNGGTAVARVVLEPGTYVAFCTIPAPDGAPHFTKGMARGSTVVRSRTATRVLPRGDVTITLQEYGFTLSRPLTHGRHAVTVTNAGRQAHELILSRLAPGKTSRDFVRWIETQNGPPPIVPMGGVSDISPGGTVLFDVDLVPGRYSLLCRVRDEADGKPHDAHGMSLDIVVR